MFRITLGNQMNHDCIFHIQGQRNLKFLGKEWFLFSLILKHLWASTRCEDPVPAEENVRIRDLCVSGDGEAHIGQREPSFCL